MELTSPAFKEGAPIPVKYTCEGQNLSPPLVINGVPPGAKSLALIMDDPDAMKPAGKVWDHWVTFNIPPETTVIGEGENPPGVMGSNTRGVLAYGGPCPPDGEHRYYFHLYALDTMLNLKEGATKKQVLDATDGHVLAQAELRGRYVRQKPL